MRAWQVRELGEPRDVVSLGSVPEVQATSAAIKVRMLACALSFPDVLKVRGGYQVKPELPFTAGIEVCGEVVDRGARTDLRVGDRVIGLGAGSVGGLGEYVLIDGGAVFAAPDELDDHEAAALFTSYQTGWFALHRRVKLEAGEVLLVHAAAGGVGSAAVQLGLACGARVIAVVRGGTKKKIAQDLGADVVIDRLVENVVERVKEVTEGRGADVIFDPVGGSSFTDSTKCVAFEGRILVIGFAGGDIPSHRMNHVLIKNYSVLGLHYAMYAAREPGLVVAAQSSIIEMVRSGAVRPLVGARVPFEEAARAMQALADGQTVGRVVVGMPSPGA